MGEDGAVRRGEGGKEAEVMRPTESNSKEQYVWGDGATRRGKERRRVRSRRWWCKGERRGEARRASEITQEVMLQQGPGNP